MVWLQSNAWQKVFYSVNFLSTGFWYYVGTSPRTHEVESGGTDTANITISRAGLEGRQMSPPPWAMSRVPQCQLASQGSLMWVAEVPFQPQQTNWWWLGNTTPPHYFHLLRYFIFNFIPLQFSRLQFLYTSQSNLTLKRLLLGASTINLKLLKSMDFSK